MGTANPAPSAGLVLDRVMLINITFSLAVAVNGVDFVLERVNVAEVSIETAPPF